MIIDDSKLWTLWYENAEGDKVLPDLESPYEPLHHVPEEKRKGFIYQHAMFPNQISHSVCMIITKEAVDNCPHNEEDIRPTDGWIDGVKGRRCIGCGGTQVRNVDEPWGDKWDSGHSCNLVGGNMGFIPDLAFAIAKSGDYNMSEAILIAARACERCMNALLHKYGLDDGYPEYSEEWHKARTTCQFCEHEPPPPLPEPRSRIERCNCTEPEKCKDPQPEACENNN